MPIEEEITIEVVRVEVGDDYRVELTVEDLLVRLRATVSLTWTQVEKLIYEMRNAVASAERMVREDHPNLVEHGFDVDLLPSSAICRDCAEGKHGACIGSAFVERGDELDEVDCGCTADGHRGRS